MKNFWILFFTLIFFVPFHPLIADISQDETASVTVPPRASDYQLSFASQQNSVSQNQKLTYQITYGAKTSGNIASQVTLVVNYSHDSAPDGSDVLSYVTNSATNAYNNTQPVVDTVNKIITWTITSLPAGVTDQTVSFQLQTTSNYTGTTSVNCAISAQMSNQYLTLPQEYIYQNYTFNPSLVTLTPNPTATPLVPTNTPVPTLPILPSVTAVLSPTPTPTLVPLLPAISDISVTGISPNSGQIGITTSAPSTTIVSFGTNPQGLNQSVSGTTYATYTTTTLQGLTPNTTYYFQVTAITTTGKKVTSDIYTFKTAIISTPATIQSGTVVVSNNNVVLTSSSNQSSKQGQLPVTVVTQNTNYQVVLSFPPNNQITKIVAVIRNKNTLAINTFTNTTEDNTRVVAMIEREPGVYIANITTPITPGDYQVFARITDRSGNITEQKISEFKVSRPLSVYDKQTGQPLEDARIFFYFYDRTTKKYLPLSQVYQGVSNPSYTNALGQIHIPLAQGSYKIEVNAFQYIAQTKIFTLAQNSQGYPQVYLVKAPANILYIFRYYSTTLSDFFIKVLTDTQALAISHRFFNLIALLVGVCFTILGLLFFVFRTHISLQRLPRYAWQQIHMLFHKKQPSDIFGIVTDEKNMPLSGVHMFCIDPLSKNIVGEEIITTSTGRFYLRNNYQETHLQLHALRDGFEPLDMLFATTMTLPSESLHLTLVQGTKTKPFFFTIFGKTILESLGVSFEGVLLASFILELVFLTTFGFSTTLPFFLLSLGNLLVWILYVRESVERK